MKIYTLKSTYQTHKHLDIHSLIEFHFVFDAYEITPKYYDVFEAIRYEILYKVDELKKRFYFDSKHQKLISKALYKLSKNDRKQNYVFKLFPRGLAHIIYTNILFSDLIYIEKSSEKPIIKDKKEKIKKELRRYTIQDKLHFKNNFTRFWFRFIEPNLKLIELGKYDLMMEIIMEDFDNYASLPFELLAKEIIASRLKIPPFEIVSYWDKDIEIDIFIKSKIGYIVGEVKYKNKKICKNVINVLLKKCDKLGIKPAKIVLISKSGFSNELLKEKNENITLFSIENFKELL
ncbi:MAG: DUF234 domain-containing protein [Campylobacter sputorum]|uniref:DUF234 domain-containing protein n=1 Tax=Campylobacter sputorum TaxID=206 RepID=UPI000B78EEA9|nr:DUF234 domain-containing protein [Campylobacter sputorum]ASM36759.1 DUF234 domain protein [Campylobacter sputorum bv. faecalis CCUG 20703]ASM38447.1 DUF234 domain protein [Campylobacter sputorum bv. paraureolyticus LMG 11764]MDY6120742.1 DUF234 domain-containing protein [Campylobacter sputorum]